MKRLPPLLLAAGLAVAPLALSACGSEPQEAQAPTVAAARERLTLQPRRIADLKPVAAIVTTRDMGEARARIGGTLTKLAVREGDTVRKGQLIGVVTDQRLTFETGAYEAQASAAAAEAARAKADLARYRTLYEKGFYSKAGLDQAQAASQAADGQLAAVRAQRAASAELSAQGAVFAPTDGRVLTADVPLGSVVMAGQSIATVTAGEPLLRLEIPEGQARALRVGDPVPIEAQDLPGAAASGTIAQVYPAVTAGRVVADIKVQGLRAELVGQRVRVRVKVGERTALVVPARYVATRYGVDFVRVLGQGGRASDVAVQIAPGPTPAEVEILSGAAGGDVLLAQAQAPAQAGSAK